MRICIIYDCLYPHTVGGAERWYRSLAERLVDAGHEVTYLTLRQWGRGEIPSIDPRVRVVVAGPRLSLYAGGRRRILPPVVFGLGVLWHLVRNGRCYDVVHTASFPYFSVLAAGAVAPWARFGLIVDWHEVWTRDYWREYLGPAGVIGYAVQLLCVRLPQRAFCFSRLHAGRLQREGLRGEVSVLEGEYAGPMEAGEPAAAEPVVVFAGRLIPEKRAPLAVAAVAAAAARLPGLRGEFYGDGPDRDAVAAAIAAQHGAGRLSAPGFVASEVVDTALRRALCLLLPSRREGYGLVVVEASARGTPSVVVAGEDNAAVELVEDGINGIIVAEPTPEAIADAIERVSREGFAMRERTARWFAQHRDRLSLNASLQRVLEVYREDTSPGVSPRRPARR